MVNEKFRKALNAYAEEHDQEIKILDNHAYDGSVVGISEDGRLVYDYRQMVIEYMEDEGCTEEEAIEWLDYNTLRAIPYFGENHPIIVGMDKETLIEYYSE